MSVLSLAAFSDPSWSMSTTLEGTKFQFQFDFNQRVASWYMSIADADGVDIYNGLKIVCSRPLLRKCKDPRRPLGEIFCVTNNPLNTTPPALLDLLPGSGRCGLFYITSDWVQILQTGTAADIEELFTQIQAGGTATSPISTYGQPPPTT